MRKLLAGKRLLQECMRRFHELTPQNVTVGVPGLRGSARAVT
jgi:hypothetical protein